MPANGEPLLIEHRNSTLKLTLNRRLSLNALNADLLDRLNQALTDAEHDDSVRCIVITGARRAFSSGQDIDEIVQIEESEGVGGIGLELRDRYAPLIIRIRESPKPFIAAINGIATGAGLAIALACDVRIATDAATFITAPYRIGLMPAVGLSILLPAILGLGRAMDFCALYDRIDATTAYNAGLISRVVSGDDYESSIEETSRRLAGLPERAFAMTKAAFNAASLPNLREHLDREIVWQDVAARSPDHREGMQSFLEKRAPRFNPHLSNSASDPS
jgi:2-(1,2-epoxy-1,2-dihydrophenyl)acetyl-CoA isomerase